MRASPWTTPGEHWGPALVTAGSVQTCLSRWVTPPRFQRGPAGHPRALWPSTGLTAWVDSQARPPGLESSARPFYQPWIRRPGRLETEGLATPPTQVGHLLEPSLWSQHHSRCATRGSFPQDSQSHLGIHGDTTASGP